MPGHEQSCRTRSQKHGRRTFENVKADAAKGIHVRMVPIGQGIVRLDNLTLSTPPFNRNALRLARLCACKSV